MAIDTAARRSSVIGVLFAPSLLVPPDGDLSQEDRQTMAHLYGGIAAGGTAPLIADPYHPMPVCFVGSMMNR